MDRRLLSCGVAAFILTLAFSFWHDWRHDAAPVKRAAPESVAAPNPATPAVAPAPAAAAMHPPPASAPPEPAQVDTTADADNGAVLARRDRGAERGSRSR